MESLVAARSMCCRSPRPGLDGFPRTVGALLKPHSVTAQWHAPLCLYDLSKIDYRALRLQRITPTGAPMSQFDEYVAQFGGPGGCSRNEQGSNQPILGYEPADFSQTPREVQHGRFHAS